ncbi:hypothetical protein NPIL_78601 [Nephila pilipes]|uniref:Uncharacterized protein n=1 Tax=Nephila pilipes TaxID=299642 RepID=A0A8X6UDI6_NEPPI|nr:hypothetical protein NPIL_78601 [Nephila pilipes]
MSVQYPPGCEQIAGLFTTQQDSVEEYAQGEPHPCGRRACPLSPPLVFPKPVMQSSGKARLTASSAWVLLLTHHCSDQFCPGGRLSPSLPVCAQVRSCRTQFKSLRALMKSNE